MVGQGAADTGVVTAIGAMVLDSVGYWKLRAVYNFYDPAGTQPSTVPEIIFPVKGNQTITFPEFAPATYGDAPIDLNTYASSAPGLAVQYKVVSGPGRIGGWTLSPTLVIEGAGTIRVTAFSTGSDLYNPAPDVTRDLVVSKGTPTLSWGTSTMTYGTPLPAAGTAPLNAAAQFKGTTLQGGTYAYSPGPGAILPAGENQVTVTFQPSDADRVNLNSASASTTISVGKAAPIITWPTPTPIVYGTPLPATGTAPLNATTNLQGGTFTYNYGPGTVLLPGNQVLRVHFEPSQTDANNYSAVDASVTLVVQKGKPTITWPTPAGISYGTALSSTQLNASASFMGAGVTGSFVYDPPAGTKLSAGENQPLTVTFTPSDTSKYDAVPGSTTISVGRASQTITFPVDLKNHTVGDPAFEINAVSSSGLAISSYSVISGPASIESGSKLLITGTGTIKIRAVQNGDSNYLSATQEVTWDASRKSQTITFPNPGPLQVGISYTLNATASSGLPVTLTLVSGPATLNGNVLTLTSQGVAHVVASQAGNTSYNPADDVPIDISAYTVGWQTSATQPVIASATNKYSLTCTLRVPDDEIITTRSIIGRKSTASPWFFVSANAGRGYITISKTDLILDTEGTWEFRVIKGAELNGTLTFDTTVSPESFSISVSAVPPPDPDPNPDPNPTPSKGWSLNPPPSGTIIASTAASYALNCEVNVPTTDSVTTRSIIGQRPGGEWLRLGSSQGTGTITVTVPAVVFDTAGTWNFKLVKGSEVTAPADTAVDNPYQVQVSPPAVAPNWDPLGYHGTRVTLKILAKNTGSGRGTVTITVDGTALSYTFDHASEWSYSGTPSQTPVYKFVVPDEKNVSIGVSSTGVSDYCILVQQDASSSVRRGTRRILLNGKHTDAITMNDVLGGAFTVTTLPVAPQGFGAVDFSGLQTTRLVRFGLGEDISGQSVGALLFDAQPLIGGIGAAGRPGEDFRMMTFSAGPALLDRWESADHLRLQLKAPAGYVDIQRTARSYTVSYYNAAASVSVSGGLLTFTSVPFATYQIDVSIPDSAILAPANNVRADFLNGGTPPPGQKIVFTRTIGSDVRTLELVSRWVGTTWSELGPYQPPPATQATFVHHIWGALARIYPWRAVSAPKKGFAEVIAYATQTETVYQTGSIFGPMDGPALSVTSYSDDNRSSVLEYSELGFSDDPLLLGDANITLGAGADQHPGSSRAAAPVAGGHATEMSSTGGKRDLVVNWPVLPDQTPSNMDMSDPWLAVDQPKKETRSWKDDDLGATSVVTSYKYAADLVDGRTVLSQETKTQGDIVVGKTMYGYSQEMLNSNAVIVTTSTISADATTTLTTVSKHYSKRLADSVYRGRSLSETRPDQTKISYAYTRGTLTGSTWTPSASGPHLWTARLSGKSGTTVTSYGGVSVDPIDLQDNVSTVDERIIDSAGRTLRETSCLYSGTQFIQLASVYYGYDDFGNVVIKADQPISGGTQPGQVLYEAFYVGYKKQWERDAQGVRVDYTYTDYDQLYTATRAALSTGTSSVPQAVTTYSYDAIGRTVAETVSAPGVTDSLGKSYTYDTSSRVRTTTQAAGFTDGTGKSGTAITNISYDLPTKVTTTLPGGGLRIDEVYKDGRPKSASGSAVPDVTYDYAYDSSTGFLKTTTTATTFGRSSVTYTDWAGRVRQVDTPGWNGSVRTLTKSYNSKGQVETETVTSSGTSVYPTKAYVYDEYGALQRTFYREGALGSLATINPTTDFYIEESRRRYVQISTPGGGANWYTETVRLVWPYDGANAGTSRTSETTQEQISGLSAAVSSHVIVKDGDGNVRETTVSYDRTCGSRTISTTVTGSNCTLQEVYLGAFLVKSVNAQGQSFLRTYDGIGRLEAVSDPRIGTTSYDYYPGTALPSTITATDGKVTSFSYDADGHTVVSTFAGKSARYSYDAAGNVSCQWGDTVNPARFEYNDAGQRTKLHTYRSGTWSGTTVPDGFAGAGDTTTWEYEDKSGLLKSKTDAKSGGISYTYDTMDRVRTRTDARNITTTYEYDARGRLGTVSYSDGTTGVSYTYRRTGQLLSVTDCVGTRTFAYNENPNGTAEQGNGRLSSETLPATLGSHVITYGYQHGVSGRANGVPQTLRLDTGTRYNVTYGYDETLRLNRVGYGSLSDAIYTYVPNSNLVGTVTQGSAIREFVYRTDSDRLDTLKHGWGGVAANSIETRVTYDEFNRRNTEKTMAQKYVLLGGGVYAPGTHTDYTYTDRDELDSSGKYLLNTDWTLGALRSGTSLDYTYDSIGNRLSELGSAGVETYGTPNELNQYTMLPGVGALPANAYDANGNLLNDGSYVYTYDAENRLSSASNAVTTSTSVIVTFKYDYLGRRVEKATTRRKVTTITRFVYSGWSMLAELYSTGYFKSLYVWGLDASGLIGGGGGVGGLLFVDGGSGGTFTPVYDPSCNIISYFDLNGRYDVYTYEYDAFGRVIAKMNYAAPPFRFSTQYEDVELGLVYFGMRYYCPRLGRFINRDPIEEQGGLNLYGFCGNDAVNRYDVLGQGSIWDAFSGFLSMLTGDSKEEESKTKPEETEKDKAIREEGERAAAEARQREAQIMTSVAQRAFLGGLNYEDKSVNAAANEAGNDAAKKKAEELRKSDLAADLDLPTAIRYRDDPYPEESFYREDPRGGTGTRFGRGFLGAAKGAFMPIPPGVAELWHMKDAFSHPGGFIAGTEAWQAEQMQGFVDLFTTPEGAGALTFNAILIWATRKLGTPATVEAAAAPKVYSVAYRTRLAPESYPGLSRGAHFREANANLLRLTEADESFAQAMNDIGVNLKRTPTGLAPRRSPVGWTWHHAPELGWLELVPRSQHAPGSLWQNLLHPEGKGGYSIWGK
ncbi:hypothetical protein DB347_20335 [Opitutaceae bacterium EW11]|nr:hypothetical protein DB347_20335 [Opitutaceae bacterium EW11]